MNSQSKSLIHQAIGSFQGGNLKQAEALIKTVLDLEPENFDALHILGVICVHQNRSGEAAELFRQALGINPDSSIAHFNLATILSDSGHDAEALAHHEKAVKLAPNSPESWINYGRSLSRLDRFDEALDCYGHALRINPNLVEALSNRGALFAQLRRDDEALSDFEKALAINASDPAAWSNVGNTLGKLGRHEEALAYYERALQMQPDSANAYINKGDALSLLKRYDEAIACYGSAILLAPDDVESWCKKGNILNEIKRHDEALACYERAIQIAPERDFLYEDRLSTKMSISDWTDFDAQIAEIASRIEGGKKAAIPFSVLNFNDSPALQRKAAVIHAGNFPADPSLGAIAKYTQKDRIRIGYFSKDFHNHATSFLAAGLFERHDRSRFEVIAFSFGPEKNDEMRARLLSAFDKFIDVRDNSDVEIARLAREMEVDIAVDLQGYQTEHRTGIFACRAAPVQVNYLAYPGTMGAEYIDYIVADRVLIPPESRQYYAEKIAYLPHSYQVNDRQRAISGRPFTRAEFGLPQSGFVFCCFNHGYKITRETFDDWMRILREVTGSVLWLLEANPIAVRNLRQEAENRGVSADRLIFARFMTLPEHLARHRLADLFLDTLPYNAHTTASDALWAGLPVLTCAGDSFASRVAASLLNAIRLPELIARSREDYVQLAIDFARHPERLAEIKQRLADHRLTTPLFDTQLFTTHLEAAYTAMIERYQADLPPDHLSVN